MGLSPNLTRKTLVLAKVEGTYGTAESAVDEATDAMLVFGDGASVYTPNVGLIDYQALTGSVTRQPMKSGAKTAGVNVNTCLMLSAVAASTPAHASHITYYDRLLSACGLESVTGTGPDSLTWFPETTDTSAELMKSLTFEIYTDGVKQVVSGAMGSFSINASAGDIPRMNFTFQGKYNSPTAAATPAAVFPVDRKSLVGAANALSIKRNSATVPATGQASVNASVATNYPVVRSFAFNSGSQVAAKSDINAAAGFAGFHIPDRRPTINITFECEKALTKFSPINDLEDGITHELIFTHSTPSYTTTFLDTAKSVITAPQAQLTNVSYSDDGGIRMYNCSYALTNDDGNSTAIDGTNREYTIVNSFVAGTS